MPKIERFAFQDKDFSAAIAQTHKNGAAYIPGFLTPSEIALFQPLCRIMEADDPEYLREKSKATPLAYTNWEGDRKVVVANTSLMQGVGETMRKYGPNYPALAEWDPNMLTPLYYRDNMRFPPHKDHDFYVGIGVTVTVQGHGMFAVRQNEDTPPHESWITTPGDAVFLRMTGMNGEVTYEDEILHEIGRSLTARPRVSLAIRENVLMY